MPDLRERVLAAARAARSPGRPVPADPGISPMEALRRAVTHFDAELDTLDDEQWRRQALRGLDVQRLVGHLIGVERDFFRCLTADPGGADQDDHVAATEAVAQAQAGRATAATRADWLAAMERTLGYLAAVGPDVLAGELTMHRIGLPVRAWLVVRAFELWTHENDIRRAVGHKPRNPDPATLALMTDLAVALLPVGLAKVGRSAPGQAARVVLTGPGGGAWDVPLDGNGVESPAVRLVADAAAFCWVVANRIRPSDLLVHVSGETGLAADLLAGAAALALD